VSASRAGIAARPAPSEPYVQVSPHMAQASASAYEVDRGDRSALAAAVDENTDRISGGGVAAHHDVDVGARSRSGSKTVFAARAPARLPLH
jgi:hypothetical protein